MASGRRLPDSPTKMTQFAPLSSDSKPSGGFFSRLFKKNTGIFLSQIFIEIKIKYETLNSGNKIFFNERKQQFPLFEIEWTRPQPLTWVLRRLFFLFVKMTVTPEVSHLVKTHQVASC